MRLRVQLFNVDIPIDTMILNGTIHFLRAWSQDRRTKEVEIATSFIQSLTDVRLILENSTNWFRPLWIVNHAIWSLTLAR